MATMVGNQKALAKLLNSLIELDFDAIAAYRSAIEELQAIEDKAKLRDFMADHERHVVELRPLVEQLGEKAADGVDVKVILTKGKVVIAGLAGDRSILLAMKSNEDATSSAYERASSRTDLTQGMRDVITKNLADERRHRASIVQRIAMIDARRSAQPQR